MRGGRGGLLATVGIVVLGGCSASSVPDAPLTWGIPDASTFAVFAGRTPCPVANCEKMKIGLHLHHDPATAEPTTYELRRIYVDGGDEIHDTTGTWKRTKGTHIDPEADVVALDPGSPEGYVYFQREGERILLMLDQDLNLLVGDAAWSYTLNRID